MQLATNPETGNEEVAGYVMLDMPENETGPFRGGVEKLLVSPRWRERGVARRVMGFLEVVARREGRGLLVSCPFFLVCFLAGWEGFRRVGIGLRPRADA